MALIDNFYNDVFTPLEGWLPKLVKQLQSQLNAGGRLNGLQLPVMIEADVYNILDTSPRQLYGAGYCASDVVINEGNPLAWWQGSNRSLLGASMFGPGQAAIDLQRLEWYRIPETTEKRHVAGPFVDYLCSNEVTITASMPLKIDGKFAGVICVDVLVSSLEQTLLPGLAELGGATLTNSNGRVIISTNFEYQTGDRYLGFESDGGISTLADQMAVAVSKKYPFAIIV